MRATVPSTRVHYFFRVYSPRVSRANLPYRLIFPFLCLPEGEEMRRDWAEGRGKAGGNFSRVAPRLSVESPSRKERLRWGVVFDVRGRFFFPSCLFVCLFVRLIDRFLFVAEKRLVVRDYESISFFCGCGCWMICRGMGICYYRLCFWSVLACVGSSKNWSLLNINFNIMVYW